MNHSVVWGRVDPLSCLLRKVFTGLEKHLSATSPTQKLWVSVEPNDVKSRVDALWRGG